MFSTKENIASYLALSKTGMDNLFQETGPIQIQGHFIAEAISTIFTTENHMCKHQSKKSGKVDLLFSLVKRSFL